MKQMKQIPIKNTHFTIAKTPVAILCEGKLDLSIAAYVDIFIEQFPHREISSNHT